MTAREVWEGMLTELSKTGAPSLLLLDFNYFFNKAINLYINKRYNIYDINLQTTDDLRVLKATSVLPVKLATDSGALANLVGLGAGKSKIFDATYEVNLPQDYLHLLNCVCVYKVNRRWKCFNAGDYVLFPAKRLNGDSWSVIVNDYFQRPLPERPYYYIHNINLNDEDDLMPTNPSIFKDFPLKETVTAYEAYITLNGKKESALGKNSDEAKDNLKLDLNGKTYKENDIVIEKIEEEINSSTNIEKILESGTDLNNPDYEREEWIVSWVNEDGIGCKEIFTLESDATSKVSDLRNNSKNKNVIKQKYLTSVDGNSNFPRKILLNLRGDDGTYKKVFSNAIEKTSGQRYGNASKVRMEIRYGHDRTVFELEKVFVDYIKTPLHIRLTQEQVNLTEDTSLIMEFPDYVCQEIINELTHLVMDNLADPRLQTHPAVTQSIANPLQEQAAPQQLLRARR